MHKNRWSILFVTTSATGLVFLEQSVMPVALPAIQKQFGMGDVALLWVVNSYLLALMSFLLISGRMADILGKKSVYLVGLSLFGVATLLGAMSRSAATLLLARVIQGAGASMTLPTTSALLVSTFPPETRARAIGINTGISAIFLAIGPVIGGFLTEYFSWRMIFWIKVPILFFAILMSLLLISGERKKIGEKFHFLGAFSLMAAIVSLIIFLMQGNLWGWFAWQSVLLALLTPLFIGCFTFLSLRTDHPLLDFRIFKIRPFSGAILAIFMTQSMIAITIFWAIYFQNQMGYSPAQTGLVILTATLPVLIAAPLAGVMADRHGAKRPMTLGFIILMFSLGWLAFMGLKGKILLLAPGLLGFGLGIPMIFSPAIALALSHVPTAQLGSSASITTAARQLAATISVAAMTALFQATLQKSNSYAQAFSAVTLLAAFCAVVGFLCVRLIIPKNGSLQKL